MMQMKLTEENAKLLHEAADIIQGCFHWHDSDEWVGYWAEVVERLRNKAHYGTSDGKPYGEPEPPLTDQDACVWPRLKVMVRNNNYHAWEGPFEFVGRTNVADDDIRYSVWDKSGYHRWYTQSRPATPEEIEAAK